MSLKFGGFLFKQIFKYCSKIQGLSILNQFFEANFSANCKKLSTYLALSMYLNTLHKKAQEDLLNRNKLNFKLDNAGIAELLEHYQKSKNQFDLTIYYYAILANFELINKKNIHR